MSRDVLVDALLRDIICLQVVRDRHVGEATLIDSVHGANCSLRSWELRILVLGDPRFEMAELVASWVHAADEMLLALPTSCRSNAS